MGGGLNGGNQMLSLSSEVSSYSGMRGQEKPSVLRN